MSETIVEDLACTNASSIVNDVLTSTDECDQECTLDNINAFFEDTRDAYFNE